ncbi:MAG: FxsA family protein [ANME-2 cluster archaeon]|nr:FxsA family protein [ANME-2 cluster archaeon]
MFGQLLILFVTVPFIELYILMEMSRQLGLLPTLMLVIVTGITGAALAKHQGLGVLHRIRSEMSFGQMPGDSLFDGVLVLIGAILLLTPGILTDITGFLLLIPGTRVLFKKNLKNWASKKLRSGQIVYTQPGQYV